MTHVTHQCPTTGLCMVCAAAGVYHKAAREATPEIKWSRVVTEEDQLHRHAWRQTSMPPYHKKAYDGTYNQDVSYGTLFCKKCGGSLEIVVADHRYGAK